MTMNSRCRDALDTCEKMLRDADDALANAVPGTKRTLTRRRNAINAACNALHRAVQA